MMELQDMATAPTDGTEIKILYEGQPPRLFKCRWQEPVNGFPSQAGWVFTTGQGNRGIVCNASPIGWKPALQPEKRR